MGLTHSGTVAGVAFLAKGEMQALPRVSELGITFYGRFRDDHLIIFDSLAGLKTFARILKHGHPFTLMCEAVESNVFFYKHASEDLDMNSRCSLRAGQAASTPHGYPDFLRMPKRTTCAAIRQATHKQWACVLLKSSSTVRNMSVAEQRRPNICPGRPFIAPLPALSLPDSLI